jgi:hypothetical protein
MCAVHRLFAVGALSFATLMLPAFDKFDELIASSATLDSVADRFGAGSLHANVLVVVEALLTSERSVALVAFDPLLFTADADFVAR